MKKLNSIGLMAKNALLACVSFLSRNSIIVAMVTFVGFYSLLYLLFIATAGKEKVGFFFIGIGFIILAIYTKVRT